jgi:hypothetical protein
VLLCSVFFISHDDQYMIKTMRKEEIRLLLATLPRYLAHVSANPATLLLRFFGVHRVKPSHGLKVGAVGRAVGPGQNPPAAALGADCGPWAPARGLLFCFCYERHGVAGQRSNRPLVAPCAGCPLRQMDGWD